MFHVRDQFVEFHNPGPVRVLRVQITFWGCVASLAIPVVGAIIFFASSHLNAEIFCRRIRWQCGQQLRELDRNDLEPLPLSLAPPEAASERHLHS